MPILCYILGVYEKVICSNPCCYHSNPIIGIVNVSASSGYVTISFQDYGIRGSDKGDFPHQLGKIINKTKVKINKMILLQLSP